MSRDATWVTDEVHRPLSSFQVGCLWRWVELKTEASCTLPDETWNDLAWQKVTAAYCQVYGVIHFTSPAGWLPVHRDQLRAQRSVTSMGKLYLLPIGADLWRWGTISLLPLSTLYPPTLSLLPPSPPFPCVSSPPLNWHNEAHSFTIEFELLPWRTARNITWMMITSVVKNLTCIMSTFIRQTSTRMRQYKITVLKEHKNTTTDKPK